MNIMSPEAVARNRQAIANLVESFGVLVKIIRTTHTNGAFEQAPSIENFEVQAIKEFISKEDKKDQFRNMMGPAEAHEQDLFIFWDRLVELELIQPITNKILIDHNDLVEMEGEVHQILAFSPTGYMALLPSLLQMRIKRRWADVNQASIP